MAQAQATINVALNTSQVASQLRALQTQINAFSNSLNKGNFVQANEAKRFQQQLLDTVNTSRFFTAELVKMRSAASTLDVTLSKGQATLGQYFSARFVKSSTAAAQVMSLANARARSLETQFIATSGAAAGFREAVAIRPIAAFSDAVTVSGQKLAIHRAMLRQATTSMINFGKNTQWAGRQLMVGFTVPLTIFGAAAGKTFREIEREAVQFKKVYGDIFTPPGEMEQNLNAVIELSKEYTKYGIALKDTLGLAAEAAAAGSRNAALTDAVTAATRLATLGQMEQAQALETTIALQNAFQLQGEELADAINYLNMVENQTVVTLQDLAAAIPRVAPVIKGLGGDVRDLSAFMAAMQEGGVSAEQGANALKSGLASLINPTDKASEKLKEMGININAIVQTNRGDLMGTVQAFSEALKTLDEFQRQQALEQVFGKFQYARLGALFANITKEGSQASQALDIARQSSEQLAASADKELSIIEESFGVKFTAAVERFKIALMPIGEMFTKAAIPLINFATKIAEAFNNLPDFAKNFIGFATVIGGIVIPAGTMFLGLIFNLIGTLTKFGHIVGVAFKGFATGGISGAITGVSQSLRYMSLSELDASVAAQQLGRSTNFVNEALLKQVGTAESAQAAVLELAAMYRILAKTMRESVAAMPANMFVAGAASAAAAARSAARGARQTTTRNTGGTIPGFGQNKDTVPAMLTPGEFVVRREATENNLDLLHAINSGQIKQFNGGGGVAQSGRMFSGQYLPKAKQSEQLLYTTRQASERLKTPLRTTQRLGMSLGLTKNKQGGYDWTDKALENAQELIKSKGLQKTHTSPIRVFAKTVQSIPIGKGKNVRANFLRFLKSKGIPVELVDDAWIDTPFNQALRESSISARDMLELLKGTKKNIRLGPAFKNISKKQLIDELEKQLRNNPNRMYSDFGQREGTYNFGALVDEAARKIDPKFQRTIVGGYTPQAGDRGENVKRIASELRQRGVPDAQAIFKNKKWYLKATDPSTGIAYEEMSSGSYGFNKGGQVSHFNLGGRILNQFKVSRQLAKAAYGGKYSPLFSSRIPGTNVFGFGEGARQPAIGGAPGKPTTILNLIREASTDPKLANRRQFRVMVDGQEIVVNRLGERQLDRLGRGSFMRMPFETRPISDAKEKQFYQQWVADKKPGRGSEYEAFGSWMLKKGYHRNNRTGQFYIPLKRDVNEPILGEILMPRSAMSRQQQEFPSWMQKFSFGGQVLRAQQVQRIISKLGPEQARRYFAGMQTSAADQKVINSVLSRTSQKMAPAFRARQAMTVADMDKDFDSFKWTRLSGKYALSENAVDSMLRSGQRVVYYPDLRTNQLQDSLNKNRFVVTRKGGRLVFNNQFGLETTLPKSADGKYNVFSPDEIFFANQGGMAFDSSRRTIVPGMGDKDTVPAVLTPGEFVINKDATKKNLDLLHAINSGKMSNMNQGGGVATRGREFYGEIDQDIRRMMTAFGRQGQKISAAEAALMIKAGVKIGDVRRGFVSEPMIAPPPTTGMRGGMGGMRGFGLSMGIGMGGGALMMAGQQMQANAAAQGQTSMTGGLMSNIGMGASFLSMLPLIPGAFSPIGLAITGLIAAFGAGALALKAWRESLDQAARNAAAVGANLGVTANVINKSAEMFGQQSPAQRRAALSMGFSPVEQEEALGKFGQYLQSEVGQAFLKGLEEASSQKRAKVLSDFIQASVATGVMDKKTAVEFANLIGVILKDSVLGAVGARTVATAKVGSGGILQMAEEREQALSQTKAFEALQNAQSNLSVNYKQASKVVGASLQIIQDASNAQALAREEYAKGIISQSTYNEVIEKTRQIQVNFGNQVEDALKKTTDFGATTQAVARQIENAGIMISSEFIKSIKDFRKKTDTVEFPTFSQAQSDQFENIYATGAGLGAPRNYGGAPSGQQNRVTPGAAFGFTQAQIEGQIAAQVVAGANPQDVFDLMTNITKRGTGPAAVAYRSALEAGVEPLRAGQAAMAARQIEQGQVLGITDAATGVFRTGPGGTPQAMTEKQLASKVQLEFTAGGGDPIEFITFLNSIQDEALQIKILTDIETKGIDPTKFINDVNVISGILDRDLAIDIVTNFEEKGLSPAERESAIAGIKDLQKLPASIDRNIFYDFVTSNGQKILTEKEMEKQIATVTKITEKMGSQDKTVRQKAELELLTYYNGNSADMEGIKKDFENWEKMTPEERTDVIQRRTTVNNELEALFGVNVDTKGLNELMAFLGKEEARLSSTDAARAYGMTEGGIAALQARKDAVIKLRTQIQMIMDIEAVVGSGGGGGDGGGGGQAVESLAKEFERRAKEAQEKFEATNKLFKSNKAILAGPFGPEFIEYVQSQGKRFIDLIALGPKAVRKAYNDFIKEQRIFGKIALQNLPGEVVQEEKLATKREQLINRLIKQGKMTRKEAEQTADRIGEVSILANNMKSLVSTGLEIFKTGIDPANARELGNSISEAFDPSKFVAIQDFVNRGIPLKFAEMLADQGIKAGTAKSELESYVNLIKDFEQAQYNAMSPLDRANQLLDLQMQKLNQMKEIEMTERLTPLENQLDALQKINNQISRSIELEQRKIEPIQEAIDKLEEQKDKIDERYDKEIDAVNEAYDLRISALEKAEEINDKIVRQQQAQIGLASALSRGDIAAAAQAMFQMQREDAAARAEDARQALQDQKDSQIKALEVAREAEIKAIQDQINIKKAEQELIENRIKELQLQQRTIQDEMYLVQENISFITDEINKKYYDGDLALQAQRNTLQQIIDKLNEALAKQAQFNAGNTASATKVYDPVTRTFRAYGGKIKKMAYGGMVNYKGSREPAPGMAFGGMMKKYANGSLVQGMGNVDRVPAMLMPGEYVVNKASTKSFLPLLEAINNSKFPGMLDIPKLIPADAIMFNTPTNLNTDIESIGGSNISIFDSSSKNQYQINVNVNGTNASADQIANAVFSKIKMVDKKQIQGVRR